jgi:hypothetical protein
MTVRPRSAACSGALTSSCWSVSACGVSSRRSTSAAPVEGAQPKIPPPARSMPATMARRQVVLPVPASPWRMVTRERDPKTAAIAGSWSESGRSRPVGVPKGGHSARVRLAQLTNSSSDWRASREVTSSPARSRAPDSTRWSSAVRRSASGTSPRPTASASASSSR